LIYFFNIFYPVQRVEAASVNFNTLGKVVRSVGEKMGIKWTAASLTTTVAYIAANPDNKLLDWQMFGTIPDTIPIGTTGTGTFNLDRSDFIRNAQAILQGYNSVNSHIGSPTILKCGATANTFIVQQIDTGNIINIFPVSTSTVYSSYTTSVLSNYYSLSVHGSGLMNRYFSDGYKDTINIGNGEGANAIERFFSTPDGNCPQFVTTKSLPNNSAISDTSTWTGIANVPVDTVGPAVPLTVDTSTTNNYFDNDTTIYNAPLSQTDITNIYYPPDPTKVDTDGDGVPDITDITPTGDTGLPIDDVPKSLWDKLFPILLIVKLFGVLGSCLMYLVRMFQFIMTIPGIDALPIDNAAFVWFRSTQIIGIKIYDVVSSLAGVGLSFIVFRTIRRAFL
jgi:hypothetical protein